MIVHSIVVVLCLEETSNNNLKHGSEFNVYSMSVLHFLGKNLRKFSRLVAEFKMYLPAAPAKLVQSSLINLTVKNSMIMY